MSAQHTPGPWAIKAQGEPNHYFTLSNGRWLAAIQFNGELWVLEQEANARLIAAAPDLLRMLKNTHALLQATLLIINDGEAKAIAKQQLEANRTAISKATGAA